MSHTGDPNSPEELEADIVRQREQLAHTVDELSQKLDVKSQAQAKLASLKDAATTSEGSPRPEALAVAAGALVVVVALLLVRHRRNR